MADGSDVAAFARTLFDAMVAGDVETVIAMYDPSPDTLVFLEGPRWATHGGERVAVGWRAFATSPLQVHAVEWVECPFLAAGDDLAWFAGIVDVRFAPAPGEAERSVRFRSTHVLRPGDDGRWRVVHEHVSQPLADPYGIGDWLPAGQQAAEA